MIWKFLFSSKNLKHVSNEHMDEQCHFVFKKNAFIFHFIQILSTRKQHHFQEEHTLCNSLEETLKKTPRSGHTTPPQEAVPETSQAWNNVKLKLQKQILLCTLIGNKGPPYLRRFSLLDKRRQLCGGGFGGGAFDIGGHI